MDTTGSVVDWGSSPAEPLNSVSVLALWTAGSYWAIVPVAWFRMRWAGGDSR